MINLLKTVLVVTVIAFTSTSLFSQTEQGNKFVGASTNLSYASSSFNNANNIPNYNVFQIAGGFGYFSADNWLLGFNVSYSSESQGESKISESAVGPSIRYYVDGAFFLGLGYLFTSTQFEDSDVSFSTNGGIMALEAGYAAFVNDYLAIEPALGYGIGSGDNENVNTLAISIGLSIYF